MIWMQWKKNVQDIEGEVLCGKWLRLERICCD